ncbi:unnamed protein product [Heterobilharzia americana]|nr:unnamed protein product [Heterobilharzia americana]
MTLEGSSNFSQSLPPANFSNYLANSNQLNSSYHQNSQNPTNNPPLFHPAAVAAVAAAAAAAGYTQQFNSSVINRPLNLAANPCGSNSYFPSSDASRAYYASFALQQSGLYPGSNTFNNFGGMNIPQEFPMSNSTTPSLPSTTVTGFSSCLPTNTTQSENCSKAQRSTACQGVKNPKASTSNHSIKVNTKSSGVRNRKSLSAEEFANHKRQEFNELVKARTEKLMSDGPVSNPVTNSDPLSSSSSAGSTGPESSGLPNYRKLIHAVLDAKKSTLLRSPSVVHLLSSQQRSLSEFKQQTELFCITMNR